MLTLLLYWLSQSSASGKGGGGASKALPIMTYMGNSFRLQLYERVGISIRGVKRFKGLTSSTDAFHAYEKVEKKFWFCDLFVFIYSS